MTFRPLSRVSTRVGIRPVGRRAGDIKLPDDGLSQLRARRWPFDYSRIVPQEPRLFRSLICRRRRSLNATTFAGRAANPRPLRACFVVLLLRMESLRVRGCLSFTRGGG